MAPEHVRLVFPPPRDPMLFLGLAFIFACIALFAATGAALAWAGTQSMVWGSLATVAAIASALWMGRRVLRETWSSRRVEIDPVARVVRVYAPTAVGLARATATVAFDSILRIDGDARGCVRIVCRDDRTIEIVDAMHPCTVDGARKIAERVCEIVFGTVLPLPPQPPPPKRPLRVASEPSRDDAEMRDDAGREESQTPRRRTIEDE